MDKQPWIGSTVPKQAAHEPQVKRKQKSDKATADEAEESYQAWRRAMVTDLWGRP